MARTLWPLGWIVGLWVASPVFAQGSGVLSQPSDEQIQRVATSPRWLSLLHFKRRGASFSSSKADSPSFFFSPLGKTDPVLELKATVEALTQNEGKIGPFGLRPRCAFPERMALVREELGIVLGEPDCPDYEAFKKGLPVDRVSFVYSSAYANNPASMFGHTFLKLGLKDKPDLLSYGVAFAADADAEGLGIAYVFNGLFGGYRGFFNLSPFFSQVNEYARQESRDLWSFPLKIPPDRIERLVRHLWELKTTAWFDYFFIDENCTYFLFRLLDVAMPEWELSDRTLGYVLPANAIKALYMVGAIAGEGSVRVGARRELLEAFNNLSREEQKEFWKSQDAEFAPNLSPAVLRFSIRHLKFLQQKEPKAFSPKQAETLHKLLVFQSEQAAQKNEASRSKTEVALRTLVSPDRAHDSTQVRVGGGDQLKELRNRGYAQFTYRWGLHDFLDPEAGYPEFSEMVFLETSGRYYTKTSDLALERFRLFEPTSITPFTPVDPKVSWSVRDRIERPKYSKCKTCVVGQLAVQGGLATGLPASVGYALLSIGPEVGRAIPKRVALFSGVRLGTVTALGASDIKILVDHLSRYDWLGGVGWVHETEVGVGIPVSKVFQIRVNVGIEEKQIQSEFGFHL